MTAALRTGLRRARLAGETDLAGFRAQARRALADGVPPEAVRFVPGEGAQADLFASAPTEETGPAGGGFRIPVRMNCLIEEAGRHSHPARFDLLYAALWRLRDTPGLLDIASDPLVRRLEDMARAVRRDRHKMTAFVRFREMATPAGPRFVAWFEPEHFVEEWAAPHFVDRFAAMAFAILTPRVSIVWDEGRLSFGPGARAGDAPGGDGFSLAWDAYYRSIFNPARLAPKAMLKEMPKKYWRNLPETRQAPGLIAQARAREAAMLDAAPAPTPTRALRVAARRAACSGPPPQPGARAQSLAALAAQAGACRRCPLGACATQTVFGEGPQTARAMLVGEQPGDREDLAGKPFIGPAGGVLDDALARAGLDRAELYLTNAVKHFKHEPRGKRRLHRTPNAGEVDVCRWWLEQEAALVTAPVIVTLGATALRGVAGLAATGGALAGETLSSLSGRVVDLGARRLVATVHPAAVLRLPDAAERRLWIQRLVADLARAAALSAPASAEERSDGAGLFRLHGEPASPRHAARDARQSVTPFGREAGAQGRWSETRWPYDTSPAP